MFFLFINKQTGSKIEDQFDDILDLEDFDKLEEFENEESEDEWIRKKYKISQKRFLGKQENSTDVTENNENNKSEKDPDNNGDITKLKNDLREKLQKSHQQGINSNKSKEYKRGARIVQRNNNALPMLNKEIELIQARVRQCEMQGPER